MLPDTTLLSDYSCSLFLMVQQLALSVYQLVAMNIVSRQRASLHNSCFPQENGFQYCQFASWLVVQLQNAELSDNLMVRVPCQLHFAIANQMKVISSEYLIGQSHFLHPTHWS